jgi:hypothetical protein
MNAPDLLYHLASLGVTVAVEDGALAVDAPVGVMTTELTELVREHKPALLAALSEYEAHAKAADDHLEALRVRDLLSALYRRGVTLTIEGETCKARGLDAADPLLGELKKHKARLCEWLGDGEHLKHEDARAVVFRVVTPADSSATRYVHAGLTLCDDLEARGHSERDALRLARQRLGTFADWRARALEAAA